MLAANEIREPGAGVTRHWLILRWRTVLGGVGGGSSAPGCRPGLTGVADLRRVDTNQTHMLAVGQNQGIAIDDMPDLGNFRGGGNRCGEEGAK